MENFKRAKRDFEYTKGWQARFILRRREERKRILETEVNAHTGTHHSHALIRKKRVDPLTLLGLTGAAFVLVGTLMQLIALIWQMFR